MKFFGLEIRRTTKAVLSPVSNRSGWWPLIRERSSQDWQRNKVYGVDSTVAHHAVFSCVTRIARDVAKLRPMYVVKDEDGIWSEQKNATYNHVLRSPNRYQNHVQFKECWIMSKLLRGNTYVLKERDDRGGPGRGNVRALYILDPSRVTVLVADTGAVFYQLQSDNLAALKEANITVPASEIIHDRMNCLHHQLVGISPIFASGLAADIGLTIQNNSANFFAKGSNNSGVLTAPEAITKEQSEYFAEQWEANYGGTDNAGKVAVLGGGLTFVPLRMSAVEAQLIDQLKWSAQTVCSTFHVPAFKVGVGDMPANQNAVTLNEIYYTDCLQSYIEEFEAAMDGGLGLDGEKEGVELDTDGLLRMDEATRVKALVEGVRGALFTPNEGRARANLKPLKGGGTVYLQHQDYPIEVLADRKLEDVPVEGGGPEPEPDDGADTRAALAALTVEVARLTERAVVPMSTPNHVEREPEVTDDEFNHFWLQRAAA